MGARSQRRRRRQRRDTPSYEEKQDQQEKSQIRQRMIAEGEAEFAQQAQYLDALAKRDLPGETKKVLANLVSQELLLSNSRDEEQHEFKWRLKYIRRLVEVMHPPEGSIWTGDFREQVSGGEDWALKPLSDADRTELDTFLEIVEFRARRSRDGWQQDQIGKTMRVAKTEDLSDDDDGGLFG